MKNLGFAKSSGGGVDSSALDALQKKVNALEQAKAVHDDDIAKLKVGDSWDLIRLENAVLGMNFIKANEVVDQINTAVVEHTPNLQNYVQKGNNGTWADNLPLLTDAFIPTRLGGFAQGTTANRPTGYGTIIGFSNTGEFVKRHNHWINHLAFGTDGRVFFSQSINGGQFGAWAEFITTKSNNAIVQCLGVKAGNDLSKNGVVVANGFEKRWAKITGITPTVGEEQTINNFFHRKKIVSLSYRIDDTTLSYFDVGMRISTYDYSFNLENANDDMGRQLGGKPFTMYVEYEP